MSSIFDFLLTIHFRQLITSQVVEIHQIILLSCSELDMHQVFLMNLSVFLLRQYVYRVLKCELNFCKTSLTDILFLLAAIYFNFRRRNTEPSSRLTFLQTP